MVVKNYNWTRFWVPRDGNLVLERGGYLQDPQSQYGNLLNPGALALSAIEYHPCLVLLGEPGIGKSRALQEVLAGIEPFSPMSGDQVLFRNLNLYTTDSFLVQDVFEGQEFLKWQNGSGTLYLVLDSLDECLLRVDTVANILAQKLRDLPADRVKLRISCRTAMWPKSLEDACTNLWGEEGVGVYELAPLRMIDVESAASSEGLDAENFLMEAESRNAVALAAKPITLTFLLNTFKRHGGFPQDQAVLYNEGCRLLCEEQNESRLSSGRVGTLTPEQRLVTASRIAACTVFGHRAGIWATSDHGDAPEEFVTLSDLAGGTEIADGNEFVVSTTELTEVLDTGLFSSRGQHRMGWAHQTYAEYLAAYYCSLHNMTERQLLGLFVHPADPEGGLVPQLSQVAAWIVNLVPDMFDHIRARSPEALLRGDINMFDHQKREALVAALFDAFKENRLTDWFELGLGSRNLWHPQLAVQIRLYLADPSQPEVLRELAVDIAEGARLVEVLDTLVRIALDTSEPTHLRVNAALAIARIGDERARLALTPLALAVSVGESDQEIKGAALEALWPDYIGVEEVLAALESPRPGVIGLYWMFLSSEFAKGLRVGDLPATLAWVTHHSTPDEYQDGPYENAMDSIMAKAWDHLDAPNVAEAFAGAALARLGKRPEVVKREIGHGQSDNPLEGDAVRRRTVISAIVPLLADQSSETIRWRLRSHSPLALPADLSWMAEMIRNPASVESERVWAALMRQAFRPEVCDHLQIAFEACQDSLAATEEFSWIYAPVELDSPRAQEMRDLHRLQSEWQADRDNKPLVIPPPSRRILNLLGQFEDGDLSAWWKLNLEMTLEPDSSHYGSDLIANLTTLPGWNDADEGTRARLVEAARQYIINGEPGSSDWIGTNRINRSALAGYRAFRLIWIFDPSWVGELPNSHWERWASVVMACRELMDRYPSDEGPSRILCLAYNGTPDAVIATAIKLIDKDNVDHRNVFVLDALGDLWDTRLAAALVSKLNDDRLAPEALGALLRELLQHKEAAAEQFVQTIVGRILQVRGRRREKAIVCAREFFTCSADSAWSVVWPIIQRRSKVACQILSSVAGALRGRADGLAGQLDEHRLAQLFVLLEREFPYSADPKWNGEARGLLADDEVRRLRDDLLTTLRDKGTSESMDAIVWIKDHLPKLDWLVRTAHSAKRNTLIKTWTPPRPAYILDLAMSNDARYVQSGTQLLDILHESLERYQANLHGELTPVRALWDRVSPGKFRPVEEEALSDNIALHLRNDLISRGIVINREVQIRRGQKTDIYIDAISPHSGPAVYEKVSAIVEVKGCWNTGLRTAMKTQLVERYMNKNMVTHGLYLAGWFGSPRWDPNDRRRSICGYHSTDSLWLELQEQAHTASDSGLEVRAFVVDASY